MGRETMADTVMNIMPEGASLVPEKHVETKRNNTVRCVVLLAAAALGVVLCVVIASAAFGSSLKPAATELWGDGYGYSDCNTITSCAVARLMHNNVTILRPGETNPPAPPGETPPPLNLSNLSSSVWGRQSDQQPMTNNNSHDYGYGGHQQWQHNNSSDYAYGYGSHDIIPRE